MHTIDLLKGEGIPAKATFGTVCLVGLIVIVPILAGSVMAGWYLQNREIIAIDQQAITSAQQTIERYKGDVAAREQMEDRQAGVNVKLAEVKSCLDGYVQWSPVLATLAQNMPEGMVMSRLAAETRQSRQTVFKGNDQSQPTNVTINTRVLVLDLAGVAGGSYGAAVRAYGDRLKSSPVLGPRLENVVHSEKPGEFGEAKTVIHTMELVFKGGS